MTKTLDSWLESGKYLPEPLRDFHDQKEVFKAMHEIVKEDPCALVKRPDWIQGQCYVIDVFLWFMARRGWTMQRSRMSLEFRDLESDVEAKSKEREAQAMEIMASVFKQPPAEQGVTND